MMKFMGESNDTIKFQFTFLPSCSRVISNTLLKVFLEAVAKTVGARNRRNSTFFLSFQSGNKLKNTSLSISPAHG